MFSRPFCNSLYLVLRKCLFSWSYLLCVEFVCIWLCGNTFCRVRVISFLLLKVSRICTVLTNIWVLVKCLSLGSHIFSVVLRCISVNTTTAGRLSVRSIRRLLFLVSFQHSLKFGCYKRAFGLSFIFQVTVCTWISADSAGCVSFVSFPCFMFLVFA